MRLPVEKMKEAILHPNREVREAAVYYFSRSCSGDPTIMPLAIQSIELYGLESFEIFTFLGNLVQTNATVAWLITEIERLVPSDGERDLHYAESLVASLRHADSALLNLHKATISEMRNLDDVAKGAITDRIFLDSLTPNALWGELTAWCESQDVEQPLDEDNVDEDYEFACSVVKVLSRYPEQFAGQVLAILKNPDEHGDWLEQMAAQLAGEMKLESAIPHLIDRFDECGTWLYEEVHWAVTKIGTDTVVEEIVGRYADAEWDFRSAAASQLEDIHTDLSVQTCLDLLRQEADEVTRGILLQSVLMNFATEGIEPARQFILSTPKTPDVIEVRNALFVACKLLGETIPEHVAWLEDSKGDSEFRQKWYAEHGLGIGLDDDCDENDSPDYDEDVIEDFDDEAELPPKTVVRRTDKVGRNDPCPCGSGKKFKKCCLNKPKAPR